jgi:hypothetical protein
MIVRYVYASKHCGNLIFDLLASKVWLNPSEISFLVRLTCSELMTSRTISSNLCAAHYAGLNLINGLIVPQRNNDLSTLC